MNCLDPRLFAAGDDLSDGFALGVSDDDGRTWQPLMHFADIKQVKSCPGTEVAEECMSTCVRLSSIGVLGPQVCGQGPKPDAGAPDVGASDAGSGVTPPTPGCGCNVGGRGGGLTVAMVLAILGLILMPRTLRRGRRCDNLPHSTRR